MSRMVKVSTNVGPLVKMMSQKQQEKMFQERKSENGIRPYFKNYKTTGVLRREVS